MGGCRKTSPCWLSRADAAREEAIPKSRRRPRAHTPADAAAIFMIADIARVLGVACLCGCFIVSNVVLANADTHDILGTDRVVHADAYVDVVTAHAGTITG